jgi:hypothetical protein
MFAAVGLTMRSDSGEPNAFAAAWRAPPQALAARASLDAWTLDA